MHDLVTKLASLSRMLGSVWCAICPYSSRLITGSASKTEKGTNFIKQTFPKKGVGKFSKKKIHFWNQQGVSFRMVCFVCFEPSDPFQRTVCGCRAFWVLAPKRVGRSGRGWYQSTQQFAGKTMALVTWRFVSRVTWHVAPRGALQKFVVRATGQTDSDSHHTHRLNAPHSEPLS